MIQYYDYNTLNGHRSCLIAERGRKWMTLLVLDPQLKTMRVRNQEEAYMTPVTRLRKNSNNAVYKRASKMEGVSKRAKRLLSNLIRGDK